MQPDPCALGNMVIDAVQIGVYALAMLLGFALLSEGIDWLNRRSGDQSTKSIRHAGGKARRAIDQAGEEYRRRTR